MMIDGNRWVCDACHRIEEAPAGWFLVTVCQAGTDGRSISRHICAVCGLTRLVTQPATMAEKIGVMICIAIDESKAHLQWFHDSNGRPGERSD